MGYVRAAVDNLVSSECKPVPQTGHKRFVSELCMVRAFPDAEGHSMVISAWKGRGSVPF